MLPKIYIYVNGIMTIPGDAKEWNARAVTFTHIFNRRDAETQRNHFAEKLEYFCDPIGRAFGQTRRARKLGVLLNKYRDQFDIILVGHSNGCDVILDALKATGWPKIAELHLVSGACEADFQANGLNHAIESGRIGKVLVYIAGRDRWLALAHTIFGKLLGYGTLGLHGPRSYSFVAKKRLTIVTEKQFHHSTWWNPKHFSRTMNAILNHVI